MTKLLIPKYQSKEELYNDLDGVISYISYEDVYLAHFKTEEFLAEEKVHNIASPYSIRNTPKQLNGFNVPVIPGLTYKIATCFFSENRKTFGLKKHFHLPRTQLPTITIGKKVYDGKDDVTFKFYRRNSPPDIVLKDDFVLRFDSCSLPHEIQVNTDDQSVWLFIVIEHCGPIDLSLVKDFYDCDVIHNYYE